MTPTPEALTPEERESISLTLSVLKTDGPAYPALAKLLRIHDQQAVEIDNLRFRLSMAESNNPDSVLSKHNAMLMAIADRDRLAAALSALAEIPDAILEAWRTDGSVWQSNVAVEELARRGKRYTRAG